MANDATVLEHDQPTRRGAGHRGRPSLAAARDVALLHYYARTRDPHAFSELVHRYDGMVYSACLRTTGNSHDAEDVAQECFLELARHADAVTSSVAGWLHSAATCRSLNALRNASTRRRHEEQLASAAPARSQATWEEISPHVDRALEALPEALRVPLIHHYLQERSQAEIAAELGVDQSTVSRRIERGLAELRAMLRKVGVVAPAVVLATLLTERATCAASAALTTSLAKIGLAGLGGAKRSAAAAGTRFGMMFPGQMAVCGNVAALAFVGALGVAGMVVYACARPGDTIRSRVPSPKTAPAPAQMAATAASGAVALGTRLRTVSTSGRRLVVTFRRRRGYGPDAPALKLAFQPGQIARVCAQSPGLDVRVAPTGRSATVASIQAETEADQGVVLELAQPVAGDLTVSCDDESTTFNAGVLPDVPEQVEWFHAYMTIGFSASSEDVAMALACLQSGTFSAKWLAMSPAEALCAAASALAGFGRPAPAAPDGCDRAIMLFRQAARLHPGSYWATQARWGEALCTGSWSRDYELRGNCGKAEWGKAIGLYKRLYQDCPDAGSKAEALRRIAEIQCNRIHDWRDGVATYARLLDEFPDAPASPYRTSMSDALTPRPSQFVDYDLVRFTHARLMDSASNAADATALHEEFLARAPKMDSIRFSAQAQYAQALRRLGDDDRADDIEAQIRLCDAWLVIGPFTSSGVPTPLVESDFLAGRLDVARAYPAVGGHTIQNRVPSQSEWRGWTQARLSRVQQSAGACYALTHLTSAKACAAQLRVGACKGFEAWLNGKRVLAAPGSRLSLMDQNAAPVQLKAGDNELFVKFTGDAPGESGVYVRLTDGQGKSLPGVTPSVPGVSGFSSRRGS